MIIDFHHLLTGTNFDLVFIVLAFVAGRSIQYRESLYLMIFMLKLSLWIAKKVPKRERKHIETSLDGVLKHILIKHKRLLHDHEAPGNG